MIDLQTFFKNPFKGEELTLDHKKKFGEDAIKRFTNQNATTPLATQIDKMTNAQTNLFGTITSTATSAAIKEARTKAVDILIDRFIKRVSKFNKYLEATDVSSLPVYQEFFPQGVRAITEGANKGNIEQHMNQMVTAITGNTTISGGAAVLTEFQAFKTDYTAARAAQLTKISETGSGRIDRDTAEVTWNDVFFDALLTVSNLNRSQPEKLSLYFNQSILRTPKSAASDGKGRIAGVITLNGLPAANVTVHVIDGNINDFVTDATGSYTTQSLPIGTYQVTYSDGIYSQTETIIVVDDGDTLRDVILEHKIPD